MRRRPFYASAATALLPAALPHYDDLTARGLLHRFALHHRSSQAFALNLFAPLDFGGQTAVLRAAGLPAVPAAGVEFEHSDDLDRLCEARPGSPHRTQVDVVLRGTTPTGLRVVALIEVKLTEIDFGECSAFHNPDNPIRDVCRSPGLFGGDVDRCFQLASHGGGRRRYDHYLRDVPVSAPVRSADAGGCIVRCGLNQPMRNIALAHVLLEHDMADEVAYVVCAPKAHGTIWRRFEEVRATFPDTAHRTCAAVPAEDVARCHADGGAAMRGRYPFLLGDGE